MFAAEVSINVVGGATERNGQVVYAQRGDVIQLVCTSSSPPARAAGDDVTLTWYHNRAPINPAAVQLAPSYRRLRVRNARLTSRLTINDISELDSGQYMCIQRPGDDTSHIEIMVVGDNMRSNLPRGLLRTCTVIKPN